MDLIKSIINVVQNNISLPVLKWLLPILALTPNVSPSEWPDCYGLRDGETFDFIVVGSGSAGAVVAARLSEIKHWNVLLLEAGGDPPILSEIPSTFTAFHRSKYDWNYPAVFDKGTGQAHPNGVLYLTRGKLLGGSSSINYEIYMRGVPRDYDEWNATGWDSNTVLHYFKKLEGMTDPTVLENPRNADLHSTAGPVLISRPKTNSYFEAMNENYLKSLEEIGFKRLLENNGPDIFGASTPHFTFANGRRSSTAEAYLKPNKDRTNLHVTKFARVTKVLIDQKRAKGVKVLLNNGVIINIYAKKEVILSAGSIDTPKILMLSGIGPKEKLDKVGIETIVDLPVGKNLQDHQLGVLVFTGLGIGTAVQNLVTMTELNSFPVPIQSGYFNIDNSSGSQPQFQLFNIHAGAGAFPLTMQNCKIATSFDDPYCYSMALSNVLRGIHTTQVVLLHPQSRGQVTLKSKDFRDNPTIELGFFRDKSDEILLAKGLKFMTRLIETSHFRKVQGSIVKLNVTCCEGIDWGSLEYWICYVRNAVTTLFHPVGTCAMGVGQTGVVDEELRVRGVYGLRIIDASIMPTLPSGNTNVPTIMIGERGSDLIKSDHLNCSSNDII